jgi:hypothetical protein
MKRPLDQRQRVGQIVQVLTEALEQHRRRRCAVPQQLGASLSARQLVCDEAALERVLLVHVQRHTDLQHARTA